MLWLWCRPVTTGPDSTPSRGTSISCRCGPKKTKDQKQTNKNPQHILLLACTFSEITMKQWEQVWASKTRLGLKPPGPRREGGFTSLGLVVVSVRLTSVGLVWGTVSKQVIRWGASGQGEGDKTGKAVRSEGGRWWPRSQGL